MPRKKEIDPTRLYRPLFAFLETELTEQNYLRLAFAALEKPRGRAWAVAGLKRIATPEGGLVEALAFQKRLKDRLENFRAGRGGPLLTLEQALDQKLRDLMLCCAHIFTTKRIPGKPHAVKAIARPVKTLQRCPICNRYFGRRARKPQNTCGEKECLRGWDELRRSRTSPASRARRTRRYIPPGTPGRNVPFGSFRTEK